MRTWFPRRSRQIKLSGLVLASSAHRFRTDSQVESLMSQKRQAADRDASPAMWPLPFDAFVSQRDALSAQALAPQRAIYIQR